MNEEKAMKVFDLISKTGDEELTSEEVSFLNNNLAPFTSVLIEAGVHTMTKAGMDKEEALSILELLAMVSRMAGASNFVDFVNVKQMEG